MTPDPLLILRDVNYNLRAALDRFHPQSAANSVATPEELSALTADLLRAGECMQNLGTTNSTSRPLPSAAAKTLQQEMATYRANLETLQASLPDIHARLLAEKARLQTAEKHIASASAWAQANGKAL